MKRVSKRYGETLRQTAMQITRSIQDPVMTSPLLVLLSGTDTLSEIEPQPKRHSQHVWDSDLSLVAEGQFDITADVPLQAGGRD